MQRRQLLWRLGVLGTVGLAGCTSTPTDDSASPTDTPAAVDVADRSIETVGSDCRTGERDAHDIQTDERAHTVTITGTLITPTPCYDAVLSTVEYEADEDTLVVVVDTESTADDACVTCLGAVEYEATIEFTTALPGSVDVRHAGQPATATPATPSLVDSSVSVSRRTQDVTETTADVAFDDDSTAVVVSGTIEGTDGCKTATLGQVTYNASDDRLTVAVETTDRENADNCTQALVYIDYAATIEFEGALPTSVAVRHDGQRVVTKTADGGSVSTTDDRA